jgi:hypothetical protein
MLATPKILNSMEYVVSLSLSSCFHLPRTFQSIFLIWQHFLPSTVFILEPQVLIEGVLFRARYLGSTQLVCEGQPTKSTRMMQAEEAVSRIKVNLKKNST